jgi:putative ABC transport system ATP-binding protein
MALFQRLNRERGMTVMLVTHEPDVAAHAKRLVTFRDGNIISDAPIAPKAAVLV